MTAQQSTVTTGAWVEIQSTLLDAGQRAAGIPEDTAATPLVMRVRGHLTDDGARLGDSVTVRTLAGRHITGELIDAAPRHAHDFGDTDPDVLASGLRMRALASEREASV